MTTNYVILRVHEALDGDEPTYGFVDQAEAYNSEAACKKAATSLSPEELDRGITLIAVPERSWTTGRHELRAETRRVITGS